MAEEDWDDIDREILERRARALAAAVERDAQREAGLPLLEFRMMGAPYALPLGSVDAVARIGDIHPIPLTPRHIAGIIHRRGEAIALVNLRRFFHPDGKGIADADFALVVRAGGRRFALQVEEITGVRQLPAGELGPPPENYDRTQAPYVSGVSTDGLSVIDLERLVSAEGFAAGRQNA
jgi:purine-binding chemotaxis protein CheW